MKSLWPILSLIGLGLLQGLVVAQGASETTVSSLPTQTTSTIPSDSATTPTGLPTVSPIFSCPRNCSGIGTCLQDGSCLCPITDPRTGIRWFTPPTPDCYFYGAAAFGVELITFQVSWALLNLFGVFIMIALLASLYRENGNRIPNNVKSLCFSLITLGFLGNKIYFDCA